LWEFREKRFIYGQENALFEIFLKNSQKLSNLLKTEMRHHRQHSSPFGGFALLQIGGIR